ncbi:MAG: hypothetical protein Q8R32_02640 [bacterium]|nr:hypothetical protein [bacterium]
MRTVFSLAWHEHERPFEDAFLADEERGMFLVADGVTRTPGPQGYPNPSPAREAADALLHAVHATLRDLPFAPESFVEACRIGNQRIRELNEQLGFWNHTDYLERDLAGAVFAGAWLRDDELLWAVLADCGVAALLPTGTMAWETADQLVPVRQHFPKPSTREERFETSPRAIEVRRDFRNKPSRGLDRTYGVFTGEDEALQYLETGSRTLSLGETMLVFTDGIRPFFSDAEFRSLLCNGTAEEIQQFIPNSPQNQPMTDKTLIVLRPKKTS